MSHHDGFQRLFEGRLDVYGHNEGGSIKVKDSDPNLWHLLISGHLTGQNPIGIYPLRSDGTVRWGCVDIDFEDRTLARNLQSVLAAMHIDSWVEVSRSKGYHVWVFAQDWVPAQDMQHALRAACQIAEYQPKEVNPKQTSLAEGEVGNYVRLPYPHIKPDRQVVLGEDDEPLPWMVFVDWAWDTRNMPEVLAEAAALYVPPPPPKPVAWDRPAWQGDPVKRLPGLAYTIYRDGPLEGQDRSLTLFRLAAKCEEAGLAPAEALDILTDADLRWGKFHARKDGERQLALMVERAYR